MVEKITTTAAPAYVDNEIPFRTHGSMAGQYVPEGQRVWSFGQLPSKYVSVMNRKPVRYVVFSYSTPIFWVHDDGERVRPDVRYSVTTSKHQGKCPRD
jgi:hypothetical protein